MRVTDKSKDLMWYVNECKQTLRRARGGKVYALNPFTPMNDQDRISPYNIDRVSGSQVMRMKKNINYGIIS